MDAGTSPAAMNEEFLLEHEGVPVHLSLEVSREEYEAMIEPFIERTLAAVHVALEGAKLGIDQIDEVLLVGGATPTPLVARRLEEVLGRPPRSDVRPDLCVAMGAAVQAALIAGQQTGTVLIDVTPYTFGTSAMGELDGEFHEYCFVPLIRKNTPIPVSKSDVFFTMFDNQPEVRVSVYQGEDRDALNNIKISEFTITGLSREPAGNPIVLGLSLDLNGILEVPALEKKTGLARSITIAGALGSQQADKVAQARERVQALLGEPAGDVVLDERGAEVVPPPEPPSQRTASFGTSPPWTAQPLRPFGQATKKPPSAPGARSRA